MGRGKRQEHGVTPQSLPPRSAELSAAELIYSGTAFAVKVTEQDHDKSALQLEFEGGSGSPDNGHILYGPYASAEEAEQEAVRAHDHYETRKQVNKWDELELDWRVEVVPWPLPEHQTFSGSIAEQEARKRGVRPEDIDLREVFGEPIPIGVPGPSSRPSSLAERSQ